MAVVVSVYGKADLTQIQKAEKQLAGMKREVTSQAGPWTRFGSAVSSTGAKIASGLVAAGLTRWLIGSVAAARQSEVTMKKLQTTVTAVGGSWGAYSKIMQDVVDKQSQISAFSGGELKNALSALTQTTGSASKGLNLLGLATDLARAKNMDLGKAATLVGKVAMGNTGSLARYGIVLKKGATASEALAAMQKRFAGQAAAYGNTSAGAQQKFTNALKKLQVTVGTALLPSLTALSGKLVSLLNAFQSLPGPVKNIIVGVAAVAAAGALLAPFITSIIAVGKAMKLAAIASKIWAAAQWLLNAAMSANPIGLIVIAVVALVAGLILAYKKVGWFRAFVQKAFGAIAKVMNTVWKVATAAIKWFWGWAGGFIKKAVTFWYSSMAFNFKLIYGVVKWLWSTISTAVKAFWKWAGPFISTYLKNLYAGFKTVFTAISVVVKWLLAVIRTAFAAYKTYIVAAWNAIKAVTTTVWNAIKSVVTTAVNAIRNVVRTVFGALAGVVRTAMNAVLGVVRSVANAITGALRSAWSGLTGIVSRLWSGIKAAIMKYLNFSAAMYTAGKNLVSGLWRGISSMASWIYGQVKGFASGIFNKIKEGLGKLWPFSPSVAGVELGYFLGIGIEKGIRQSLGNVQRAVGAVNAEMQFAGGGGAVAARAPGKAAPRAFSLPLTSGASPTGGRAVQVEFVDCIFVDSSQAGVERLWKLAASGRQSAVQHRGRMSAS